MLYSLILRVATRVLVPLLLLFSLFMLLRGHDLPGGGFVGGLMAAAAFVLSVLTAGVHESRKVLRVGTHTLLGAGLACAYGAGVLALVMGEPFLASLWVDLHLPVIGDVHLGSTLLLDIGVMLVVIGTVLLMVFSVEDRLPGLAEE